MDNTKTKPSGAVPPADPHLTGAADAFGIVYRPYGKKKQEYSVPTGPAFEDEAEFERDLMSSEVLKPVAAQTTDDDDEFDFEVPQAKTFHASSPTSSQSPPPSSALASLKLTTLGGGDGSEYHLDGESSGEEDEEEEPPVDDAATAAAEEPPAPEVIPLSTREAARLALAEITGIYSSGLGDHEVTILNSAQSSAGAAELTTKELSLLAKLGVKNSAIEEVDEDELERAEEREVQEERQLVHRQEAQQAELESQWAAVDSTVLTIGLGSSVGESAEESNYPIMSYKEALAVFR
jgi:hypothetical protein